MSRRTVYCCQCGERSDRGCIALCRSCSGIDDKPRTKACENCRRDIPSNQWCCIDCFALYDGERFRGKPEPRP